MSKNSFHLLILFIFSFTIMLPAQNAELQIIHNAADATAEKVDIYLNGNILLDDFSFRTATPYIDAPSGVELNIGVAPGNSSSVTDTIKNFPVTLAAGGKYVAIASGVLNPANFSPNPESNDIGFKLIIQDNARTVSNDTSQVQFFVLHGSTDAPAVDVIARGVGTLVNDAQYGNYTPYIGITIPPAKYLLDVTPASDNNTIVASFEADFSGLKGQTAVVFASGFLDATGNQSNAPFGLFAALNNGTVVDLPAVTTARLQVIHNASDPAAKLVDVYLNGNLLLNDFAFRTATPFIDAPANQLINIGIAPGSSSSVSDTLKNFAVKLLPGEKYLAVANGVLDPNNFSANPNSENTAFTLFIKSAVREESSDPNSVELLVVHGATDAPDVDVIARGVTTLVDGFKYGTITDYIKVPASNYILDIADNSSNSVVASFGADLSTLASTSATVLASGFLSPNQNQNGEGFTLIAVFADGSVASLGNVTAIGKTDKSSIINSYSLEQNYPNPFNPTTNINFALPNSGFCNIKGL